jgi:hypothetical protein
MLPFLSPLHSGGTRLLLQFLRAKARHTLAQPNFLQLLPPIRRHLPLPGSCGAAATEAW